MISKNSGPKKPKWCSFCKVFFEKFRCSMQSHGECDCPKCQGYCKCKHPRLYSSPEQQSLMNAKKNHGLVLKPHFPYKVARTGRVGNLAGQVVVYFETKTYPRLGGTWARVRRMGAGGETTGKDVLVRPWLLHEMNGPAAFPNSRKEYVTYSPSEMLFWSNEDGWVDLASATKFSEHEVAHTRYLPGLGSKFVLVSEAGRLSVRENRRRKKASRRNPVKTVKHFMVVSVSSNMNSFGLRGMILMARDGEAWQVGVNHMRVKKQGDLLRVPYSPSGGPEWFKLGYEIPHKLPKAPAKVASDVWG